MIFRDYISEQLSQLPDGNVFFNLLELPPEAIPQLIDAYRLTTDGRIRALLVNVIWEYRQPWVIPFLGEALDEDDAKVWKSSLDGLVALASPEAISTLTSARSRIFQSDIDRKYFHGWLEEAIEQAMERHIKMT